MDPQIEQLTQRVQHLEKLINRLVLSDRYQFDMDLEFNSERGTKIGRRATDTFAFWGNPPTTQFNNPTARQDISTNTGVAMNVGANFNGNTGTAYYSVGDLVYALKLAGIIKNT